MKKTGEGVAGDVWSFELSLGTFQRRADRAKNARCSDQSRLFDGLHVRCRQSLTSLSLLGSCHNYLFLNGPPGICHVALNTPLL